MPHSQAHLRSNTQYEVRVTEACKGLSFKRMHLISHARSKDQSEQMQLFWCEGETYTSIYDPWGGSRERPGLRDEFAKETQTKHQVWDQIWAPAMRRGVLGQSCVLSPIQRVAEDGLSECFAADWYATLWLPRLVRTLVPVPTLTPTNFRVYDIDHEPCPQNSTASTATIHTVLYVTEMCLKRHCRNLGPLDLAGKLPSRTIVASGIGQWRRGSLGDVKSSETREFALPQPSQFHPALQIQLAIHCISGDGYTNCTDVCIRAMNAFMTLQPIEPCNHHDSLRLSGHHG